MRYLVSHLILHAGLSMPACSPSGIYLMATSRFVCEV